VGGDFYDFLTLSDGRLGVVVGDVTDKGVPAALVMATTRSTLRAAAQRSDDPGEVLADTNRVLHGEIPPGMFVTCLYGILAPGSGDLRFANAGHNLPYVRTASGVIELRATGMPLGLLPGMSYEVKTANLRVGESMLLSSDGIAEAHNRAGAMFGLPRLMGLVAGHPGGGELIGTILHELAKFTAGGEQEDDVTMVIVRRTSSAEASAAAFAGDGPIELTSFSVPSEDGNERLAIAHVLEAVGDLGISPDRLQRLGTAVAEATMNAIEHGNHFNSDLPVDITVLADAASLRVLIKDHGGGTEIPQAETPDLDAKVAGLQTPRGWGLFLIKQMVDELHTETDDTHHTMELVIKREGAN
jgi:anti-sigma regulatory factor (Ser/Thr protein kinase)